MKSLLINFLLLFSMAGLAGNNDNFIADKLMVEIDGYGDEAFKANLYASKSDSDKEAIGLKLIMSSYFLNKDLPVKELMYPYKNKSFQDSINSEIKNPSNTSLEMITTIISQCLYGSMQYKEVLKACSSKEFVNRVNELSDKYETGGWATIIQDLYSVSVIIQDNKAEILASLEQKASMGDTESIKDQTPTPNTKITPTPSAAVIKEGK
jgi:hypothetical protein